MQEHLRSSSVLVSAIVLFLLMTAGAVSQEVGLVSLDTKEVAKGYRAEALKLRPVVNDKGETIGTIDDFIFGRTSCDVFAVLAVGDFVGEVGHLVAVPFRSLKINNPTDPIVLPGAGRAALQKLPVFLYNSR
jgi:PRC-barrel domain